MIKDKYLAEIDKLALKSAVESARDKYAHEPEMLKKIDQYEKDHGVVKSSVTNSENEA